MVLYKMARIIAKRDAKNKKHRAKYLQVGLVGVLLAHFFN